MIGAKPARTLNTSALKNQKKQEELTQEMDEKLKDWDSHNSENDIEEKWETLKDTVCIRLRVMYYTTLRGNIKIGLMTTMNIWGNC